MNTFSVRLRKLEEHAKKVSKKLMLMKDANYTFKEYMISGAL
jgi:hypothetical protein